MIIFPAYEAPIGTWSITNTLVYYVHVIHQPDSIHNREFACR